MDQIISEFKSLHLTGMAEQWKIMTETRTAGTTTLRDGISLLIQAENDRRRNNRTARLIKNARFRYSASMEQVACDPARGVDKQTVNTLVSCQWIRDGTSVLVTGASGVGKSYLATALGYQACLMGYRVQYYNMSKLMEAVKMARIEACVPKFFERMAEADLVIIDDFGMRKLDGQQLLDFMEILEDRHGRKSTIIASQLPVVDWYEIMEKNKTVADAVMDRLAKTAYRFELKGESLRK